MLQRAESYARAVNSARPLRASRRADFRTGKENDMTTSQALRAERRAQRERLERHERAQTALAALFLIALLAVFAVAGTMDYHDQMVYQQSWAEAHGC